MIDPHPCYRKTDGFYVVRQIVCKKCPLKKPNAKGEVKSASTLWYPVDKSIGTVTMIALQPRSVRLGKGKANKKK